MKQFPRRYSLLLGGIWGLTIAGGTTAQAPDIGRLLLSPVERSTVERVRANINAGLSPEGAPVIILPDEVAAVARSEPQTINGWVLRAGQRSTVWVNGEPYYRFDNSGETRRALEARGLLAPPKRATGLPGQLALRPGQTRNPDSSEPIDLLPPGAFRRTTPGGATSTGALSPRR